MLKILICCVLSVFVIPIGAEMYTFGTVLRDNADFICNRAGPQCGDDCTTLLLCGANAPTPFANISCATTSPKTPYCVKNSCSASPSDCSSASSFRCTSVGVFPDPTDCTRYRHCNESGGESTIYVCPRGFIFNSRVNLCQMRRTRGSAHSSICNKVDCSRKINEIVIYESNPAYYAFCFVANGTRETILYKCDFEQYQIFDPTVNMCKFDCKGIGYYQDPANCSSYYICSKRHSDQDILAEKVNCPSTYFFDGTTCSKNSTNCTPGSLDTSAITTTTATTTTTTTTTATPDLGSSEPSAPTSNPIVGPSEPTILQGLVV